MKTKRSAFFAITLSISILFFFPGCTNYWMEKILGNKVVSPVIPNILAIVVTNPVYSSNRNVITPVEYIPEGYTERKAYITVEIRGFFDTDDAIDVGLNIWSDFFSPLSFSGQNASDSTPLHNTKTFNVTLEYDGATEADLLPKSIRIGLADVPGNYNYTGYYEETFVNIIDGQNSSRAIPVINDNIMYFNKYASSTEGLARHYIQIEDIDFNDSELSAYYWQPIGNTSQPFTGSHNGNNKSIQNIKINAFTDYQGIFGCIGQESRVSNIDLKTISFEISPPTINFVGGIAGANNGTVENCTFSGDFNLDQEVNEAGGIVGLNNSEGTVDNCKVISEIEAHANVGGVVGTNNGMVVDCNGTGTVIANQNSAGGVVGYNSGTVKNCHAEGAVEAVNAYAGGVVGENYNIVEKCYSLTSVICNTYAGGIAGINYHTVEKCFSTGNVSANSGFAGGIAGSNEDNEVNDCYATGDIYAYSNAGGITGYNKGAVEFCYATGDVFAEEYAGGVVGWCDTGTVENCVALNPSVSSGTNHGRVAGYGGGLNNNYARVDMNGSFAYYSASAIDGEDVYNDSEHYPYGQYSSPFWWPLVLHFNLTNIWDWHLTNTLPILIDFPGGLQNPEIKPIIIT